MLDLTALDLSTIPAGDYTAKTVTFSPDGALLAVSLIDQVYQKTIIFLDYDSRQIVDEIVFGEDVVLGISFNPAGTLMLVAAYEIRSPIG